jgi:hypothetical protein
LKKGNDQVRTPTYMRASRGETLGVKDQSVGDILRTARKALIVRQIFVFVLLLLVVACIVAFFSFGYFGKVIDYVADRLV